MAVSFASYEIARSGLWTNERGLTVTGHNISNVNTPGYVRQQAIITTGPYQNEYSKNKLYQLGLGADIQQVRQIRHSFLDNIYRQENTTLGYWESRNKTFQDVQAILGEPMGAGLQNVMNQFWDSWQELSKEPESLTVRALVRQRGEALTHQINHMGEQLDKLQNDLNTEIRVRIDEVNQITEKISKLNVEILKVEISKDTANDFRDQRNTLIDRLSKLVNAEINEMQDGQIDVTLGGYFIVQKGTFTKLYADEGSTGGLFYVPKLEGTNKEVPLKNGIIKGLMESRGEVFGAKGSSENGSPYNKADIVFAVDVSDASPEGNLRIAKIKANIDSYLKELNRPGVDYNLRLITFDGTGVLSDTNYGTDYANFRNVGINGLVPTGNSGSSFENVIDELEGISYRDDSNKYALVFTGDSIEGDAGLPVTDPIPFTSRLQNLGIRTSVITDPINNNSGSPVGEVGWDRITSATSGRLYDIDSADFGALMNDMAMDNVNDGISLFTPSNNIIPDLRKRLNALVNIMAREVNALHGNGKNLKGESGQDFFTTIDSVYPMGLGNIKLNDSITGSLTDLNNIAASGNGSSGDNTIALKIANLRHVSMMSDLSGVLSLDDYYQSTILSVGNGGVDAQRISENQAKLVQSADSYRQSITGVSMDEEMTNMMKYKFAYDAASRALNVVDDMMDTIISRMGVVGR